MRAIIRVEVDRLVAMSNGRPDEGVCQFAKNKLGIVCSDDSEYEEAFGEYFHRTNPVRRPKTPQFMGKG
jgi:hypothetical protein